MRLGDTRRNKAYATDVGSRIGASKKNAEDLLLYWDATHTTLKKHPGNKRVPELLKILEDRAGIILKTSFIPVCWSAFSGPILRASEDKDATIEKVRGQMEDCLSLLKESLESSQPYDTLLQAVLEKNKNNEYFR